MQHLLKAVLFAVLLSASTWAAEEESGEPKMGPFEVRLERSYFVPMRDGVRLSTDLYMPEGLDKPLGTILERTPYDKNSAQFRAEGFTRARFFASHGFVFAVQDKRGKYESEGQYLTTDGDIEDGDDTISWIAEQPWSNDNVAMVGCSYPGFTTMMGAQSLNPNLKAIVPQAAAMATGSMAGRYSYLWRRGGPVYLSMSAWHAAAGSTIYYRPPAGMSREEFLQIVDMFDPRPKNFNMDSFSNPEVYAKFEKAYWTLPVIDMLEGMDAPPNDWRLMTDLELNDPWWDERGYMTDDVKVDVPALHINSWRDYGVMETFIHFNHFQEKALSREARENQYVIIGPTGHCLSETVTENTMIGDLNVGDARFDYWGTYLRWYDRWLNGNKNALEGMPRVQYYNVGANEWRSADAWPIPGTTYQELFLDSTEGANSRHGDGRLELVLPVDGVASDTYVYDPATPNISYSALTDRDELVRYGAFDRREPQTRNDVLVYTTEPLTEAVDVTGPMKVVLYVSSSAKDTDFDVTLSDVFPDGRAMGVYQGVLRARYREGLDKQVFMEPGEVYEIEVDLSVTSNTFLPGHRIRLEIASSNFPDHDRNMNTGGDNVRETEFVQAVNTVHHTADYPSRLVLPIVPHDDSGQRD